MKKGLLMVCTGNGKGKTTAVLGQVFRALGRGFKVCVIQFVEGSWQDGGLLTAEKFKGSLEFHVTGKEFTGKSENVDEEAKAAKEAWQFAREVIESGRFEMVVLDELTHPMNYGMLDKDEVLSVLASRTGSLNLIVTGSDVPQALIDVADLVTEVREIKHH